jgi:Rieske Fe-S protein
MATDDASDRASEDRRRICQGAALLLAGAALEACGGGAQAGSDMSCGEPACGATAFSVGVTAADVAVGDARSIQMPQAHVFLCRDANGVYAMDAGCTHLGCDVMFVSQAAGFHCPCHGATYDYNGQHATAPAPTPLAHYAVCAAPSGTLSVDANQVVDACVRFKG